MFSETFKAKIMAVSIGTQPTATLTFTKSRIIYKPDPDFAPFQNGAIKNNAKYTLDLSNMDSLKREERYTIELPGNQRFRLIIDERNERKLKQVHKLYWYFKEPVGWLALAVSIIAVLISLFKD